MALPSNFNNSPVATAKLPVQPDEPDDESKTSAIRRRAKRVNYQPNQVDSIVSNRKQPQI